jgi:transposase-like protein
VLNADSALPTAEPIDSPDSCETIGSHSPRGGPRTTEGKAISRRNAITHAMTATTLLPQILGADRVEFYRLHFGQELKPRSYVERVIVAELARHAARLEFAEQAEEALLRTGARRLAQLVNTGDGGAEVDDAGLCSAVANHLLDQFTRYRAGHEKGFFRALHGMRDLTTSQAGSRHANKRIGFEAYFADEQACEDYLKNRFDRATWRCPRCSSVKGHWLPSRRCWECADCRRQTGLRGATVMQRSALPLAKWFSAIQLLLVDPRISPGEIGHRIGIRRDATVRRMITKIRRAIDSPDAWKLLAGLDTYFDRWRAP